MKLKNKEVPSNIIYNIELSRSELERIYNMGQRLYFCLKAIPKFDDKKILLELKQILDDK